MDKNKPETIQVEVWLYGPLAHYGGSDDNIAAHVDLDLAPERRMMQDVLDHLEMPTEERGFTFINGNLSAMPGMHPDLDHELQDGDRVAFFHLKSMWPFQYRHGVAMEHEMTESMDQRGDQGMRTRFDS
ncbi:MAG: MoaD/ThiS family protein [Chloroflexi bacterium]|jgi:molybdopterin converting factor small subunit|nr:MoaD/ThiS family protein [Chloroflexota bacterium]